MQRRSNFVNLQSVIAIVFALMAGHPLSAQVPSNQPPVDPSKAIVYRISTNDIIRIGVFQEPDLDMIARVDVKGMVNLPLIGQIKVINYTIPEAESVIEDAYQSGRFLRNPQVTISVQEYTPREVSIQGQVRTPGRYSLPIEQTMSLLELVTRAGGFTDTAKGTAVNVTRVNSDGTKEVFTVDVDSLIKGRDRAKAEDSSLTLLPGDIVYVPERII